LDQPTGVVVFGNDLFVLDIAKGTIGEYTTSGTAVDTSLISELNGPNFLVVEDVPKPSSLSLVDLACVVLVSLHQHRSWVGFHPIAFDQLLA
jgi:hypothetical protein